MQELIHELYKVGVVKIGSFVLSSGITSPFYIDMRRIYSYPKIMRLIIDEVSKRVDLTQYDVLVGVATSGVALAAFVAAVTNKPMAYVRLERKDHGTLSQVEGEVEGRTSLIVDDVATTGDSIIKTYEVLKSAGAVPTGALVVVDREQGAEERVRSLGMRYHYVMTARQLFNTLKNDGLLNGATYEEIMRYLESYRRK
ncbi:MAG: orotate phosphoribosyltransferase [Desulfurococcaceae archaeon]|jgi:orotate phosphoribosyltransferase|nr:orotate phosphoribosyltransferase [Desulfurococcaceae archaeon]